MGMMTMMMKRRGIGDDYEVDVVADDRFQQEVEIRLPEWRVLRVAARSILIAIAVLSFPWIGSTSLFRNAGAGGRTSDTAATTFAASEKTFAGDRHMIDDVFFLPMLFRDFRREGVFQPGLGRAMFLGCKAHLRLPFLKQNQLDLISIESHESVASNSLDFIFAADGLHDLVTTAAFVDRVLKVGGVVAFRMNTDPSVFFRLPTNYIPIYIRRFGSTVVAMKKTTNKGSTTAAAANVPGITGRKLMMVPESKKMALSGLEDVLLEPPRSSSGKSHTYLKRTKYLPDLTGDSLDGYPRRIFVDVGSPEENGKNVDSWFEKHYPTRNRKFEIIRVEETKDVAVGLDEEEGEEMSLWLRRNVKVEDYVVMKAEAEVVEGLVRSGEIGLVDELFLDCRNLWQKGSGGRRRAYWECVALCGKLRDEGVAVHQWWG